MDKRIYKQVDNDQELMNNQLQSLFHYKLQTTRWELNPIAPQRKQGTNQLVTI